MFVSSCGLHGDECGGVGHRAVPPHSRAGGYPLVDAPGDVLDLACGQRIREERRVEFVACAAHVLAQQIVARRRTVGQAAYVPVSERARLVEERAVASQPL